jgi:hypothetical protein
MQSKTTNKYMEQPQPQISSVPKKRGRKSKQELLNIINGPNTNTNTNANANANLCETPTLSSIVHDEPPRTRRGRKPNSSKIIENSNIEKDANNLFIKHVTHLPSVILHLKCRLVDTLESNDYTFCDITQVDKHKLCQNVNNIECIDLKNTETELQETYNYSNILTQTDMSVKHIGSSETKLSNINNTNTPVPYKHMLKEINKKIKHLDFILNSNIEIKRSACFWCTECFTNSPIYIPKHKCEETFHVYGNFCSLECAAAYLIKFNTQKSIIMEQYSLLHSLYLEYDTTNVQSIKPAPEPRYMLDKFLGNLSIDEYRSINNSNRFFILLDKPIAKITPEYHEEYANFRVQEKNIPSASS